MRILAIQGSPRNKGNCPDEWGKTRQLVQKATAGFPEDIEFDVLDLSVALGGKAVIQPCKACQSTAGGYHCHWPCDCYGPESAGGEDKLPDLMHDRHVYERLAAADGFAVFSPINWYAPSTNLKAMFDRLVCANLTMTADQALKIYGDREKAKDEDLTRLEDASRTHDKLMKNHLEGKYGAFFCHGDGGADETTRYPVPKSLRQYPDDLNENEARTAIAGLVKQCRYSGIYVPEDLVVGVEVNKGLSYPEGNDAIDTNEKFFNLGRELIEKLIAYIEREKMGLK